MMKIEPTLKKLFITVSGTSLNVENDSKAKTKYSITVDKKLKDIYGQTLNSKFIFFKFILFIYLLNNVIIKFIIIIFYIYYIYKIILDQ